MMLGYLEGKVSEIYRLLETLAVCLDTGIRDYSTEITVRGRKEEEDNFTTHIISFVSAEGNTTAAYSNWRDHGREEQGRYMHGNEIADCKPYSVLVKDEFYGYFDPTRFLVSLVCYLTYEEDKLVNLEIGEKEVSLYIPEDEDDRYDGTEITVDFVPVSV